MKMVEVEGRGETKAMGSKFWLGTAAYAGSKQAACQVGSPPLG